MYLFFFKSWAIGNILLFLHRLPKQTACHSTHYWQGCGETVALSSTTGLLCNPRAQQRVWNITCDHCIFAEFVNLVNEVNEALKLQSFDLTIPFLGACLKEITGQVWKEERERVCVCVCVRHSDRLEIIYVSSRRLFNIYMMALNKD